MIRVIARDPRVQAYKSAQNLCFRHETEIEELDHAINEFSCQFLGRVCVGRR